MFFMSECLMLLTLLPLPSSGVAFAQAGTLQFGTNSASVPEEAGQLTITVTRTGGKDGPASVSFGSVAPDPNDPGEATPGQDYTLPAERTLAWADQEDAPKTFTVQITDDVLVEGGSEGREYARLSLSGESGATLGGPTMFFFFIEDDDVASGPGKIHLANSTCSNNPPCAEGVAVTVNVARTDGNSGAASVQYRTVDGTAKAGSDYTAPVCSPCKLEWATGEAGVKSFGVAIKDDAIAGEPNETFSVQLFSAAGATLGTPSSMKGRGRRRRSAPADDGAAGQDRGRRWLQPAAHLRLRAGQEAGGREPDLPLSAA